MSVIQASGRCNIVPPWVQVEWSAARKSVGIPSIGQNVGCVVLVAGHGENPRFLRNGRTPVAAARFAGAYVGTRKSPLLLVRESSSNPP
jgi:hypothetical protein